MERNGGVSGKMFDFYYTVMLEFFNAVGSYWHLYKLRMNADEGIFPAQVIARNYQHEGVKCEIELCERERACWDRLDQLSNVGKLAGFLPIDKTGRERIMKFVDDPDRRRYIRDAAKRAQKKGELVSIADLMRKRYALEKKKAGKTGI